MDISSNTDAIATPAILNLSSELTYIIFDFIPEHDKASFAAFSLVCRDWRDAGQQYVFREVKVGSEARLEALLEALPTMSPRARAMPRELVLKFPINERRSIDRNLVRDLVDYFQSVHTLTFTYLILDATTVLDTRHTLRLKPLKALRFNYTRHTLNPTTNFTYKVIIPFIGLFCGVQDLSINLLGVYDHHPSELPGIDDSHLATAVEPALPDPSQSITLPLRHLDLNAFSSGAPILRYLCGMGAAHTLRTIKLRTSYPLEALQNILMDNPCALEFLSINQGPLDSHDYTGWTIDSSLLTNLRQLDLSTWLDSRYIVGSQSLCSWGFVLSSVAHWVAAPVETISISLWLAFMDVSPVIQPRRASAALRSLDWENLGKLLSQYPRLKEVTLKLTGPNAGADMTVMQRCMRDISRRILPESSSMRGRPIRFTCHWRYFGHSGDFEDRLTFAM